MTTVLSQLNSNKEAIESKLATIEQECKKISDANSQLEAEIAVKGPEVEAMEGGEEDVIDVDELIGGLFLFFDKKKLKFQKKRRSNFLKKKSRGPFSFSQKRPSNAKSLKITARTWPSKTCYMNSAKASAKTSSTAVLSPKRSVNWAGSNSSYARRLKKLGRWQV